MIKPIFLSLAIWLTLLLNSSFLYAVNSPSKTTDWYKLSDYIICALNTQVTRTKITQVDDQKHKPRTKYIFGPVFNPPLIFSLTLKYKGVKNVSVHWDKAFYRMLWKKQFLLRITQNGKHFTSEKAFFSSNVGYYPPGQALILTPNSILTSHLNLAGYVGNGLQKGKAVINIYFTRKGYKPILACNPVSVQIY